MASPEIAVLVSTYERPHHLRRSLASIAAQQGMAGRFEVIVTDDGSEDETRDLVESFARQVPFHVGFTTHSHRGFQLARCRNEGVAASRAPYLLFVDGDCVLPSDHLRAHLEFRRPGHVICGDSFRLDEATSARVTESMIATGNYQNLIPRSERRRIAGKAWHATLYEWLRVPMRPRLTGNNVALWRSDFVRINGFDEHFVGWGLEDSDFQRRLSRIGVAARSILHRTVACHLWHPPAPSFSRNNQQTRNLRYFHRRGVLTQCLDGLEKRAPGELRVRYSDGSHGDGEPAPRTHFKHRESCEVEVLFDSDAQSFSRHSECKILVVPAGRRASQRLMRQADYVIDGDDDLDLTKILPFARNLAPPKLSIVRYEDPAAVAPSEIPPADGNEPAILPFSREAATDRPRGKQRKGRAA